MENTIPDRYQEKTGMQALIKRNPPVETGGCKPKPTAYEKIVTIYMTLTDVYFLRCFFDDFFLRKV